MSRGEETAELRQQAFSKKDGRLRVLVVVDTLEVGGSERSTLEIARRFKDTETIVCHLYPGRTLRNEFERASLPVVSLNVRARYGLARTTAKLLGLVRQVRPDLIQATLFRSRMTARAVAAWTGIPLIETFVNDDYGRERRATFGRVGRVRLAAVRRFDAATARVAVHNIAVSRTVRDAMCEALGIPKKSCSVIYRGRDPSKYTSLEEPGASTTRASLGLGPDARLLLAVGRLVPAKDHATLLRAMPSVLSAHPEVRLRIAGGGPLVDELQAEISRLGLADHVALLGTRSDVPALLRAADMFVFPSRYEGHAGALVEAMFSGLPIVAADTPVHRESVQDGVSGILATPGDPESFAIGIRRHLDSPQAAEAMGRAARRVALERFDVRRIAEQHEECYRQVVAKS